jgi:hypothetical protein
MKRLLAFMVCALLILFISGDAFAQTDQYTINRVVTQVDREGILFPDVTTGFVIVHEFLDVTDTSKVALSGNDWLFTRDTLVTVEDSTGGIMKYVWQGADNDHFNLQHAVEAIRPQFGQIITFRTKVQLEERRQNDLFAGLSVRNTAIDSMFDLTSALGMVGFYKPDGFDSLYAIASRDTAGMGDGGTYDNVDSNFVMDNFKDSTWYELAFVMYDTSKVDFYVDGKYMTSLTTNTKLPVGDDMTPTLSWVSGDANKKYFRVDYLYARQSRRTTQLGP